MQVTEVVKFIDTFLYRFHAQTGTIIPETSIPNTCGILVSDNTQPTHCMGNTVLG